MIAIENAVNQQLFSVIKNKILGENMPWYITPTSWSQDKHLYSYYHMAIDNGKHNSEIAPFLECVLYEILSKLNSSIKHIHRIRIANIPSTTNSVINTPHVDWGEPHKTGLLYITDSDGETILYDKKYDTLSNLSTYDYYNNIKTELNVIETSEPKENKFILFDGLRYHSSSTPTVVTRRVVVNFNYFE